MLITKKSAIFTAAVALCVVWLSELPQAAAQSDSISINAPGRTIYIDPLDLPGYRHSRGDPVRVQFPLQEGKTWKETVSAGSHDWNIVFRVLKIERIDPSGNQDIVATIGVLSSPWGSYSQSQPESIGKCVYSSAKKQIVTCSD